MSRNACNIFRNAYYFLLTDVTEVGIMLLIIVLHLNLEAVVRIELDTARLLKSMHDQNLSQTELAERSGISRQTLVRLLKQKRATVQLATEQKLAAGLGLKQGALDVQGAGASYRKRLAGQHEYMDFAGLGVISVEEPVPMDQGFVPLTLERYPLNEGCDELEHKSSGSAGIEDLKVERKQLTLGGALERYKRFFVLGDPGTGKTTVLRHIARAYARRQQGEQGYPDRALTPILVRLADWAEQLQGDETVDILSAALAQLSLFDDAESARWLRDQLENQKVLVLLDGLDEVGDLEAKGKLIDSIRSLVEDYPRARLIVTSRIVGFEKPNLGKTFDTLKLCPLNEDAAKEFAKRWFAFRHKHEHNRKCLDCGKRLAGLRHALLSRPQIRAMAANPMMLTILLLLLEAGTSLPQRRWDLYRRICEAFLFSWEEKKRGALSSAPDGIMDLEGREVLWILESVAWEMQRKDWTLVPRWWLAHHISTFLRQELGYDLTRARSEADALIWSLQQRSALLKERGPERYGFSHLAFQEYFAARAALAEADPIRAIQAFLYHPRWREVVRLVAAQLGRRTAIDLLRVVLDDPDPKGRFLNRGLLVSLACLADGAPVHNPSLLSQVERATADLGKTKWLGIAREALESLTLLRDTRLGAFAERAVDRMLRNAAESLDESDHRQLLWWAFTKGFREFPIREKVDNESVEEDTDPIAEKEIHIEGKLFNIVTERIPDRIGRTWTEAVRKQLLNDQSSRVRAVCASELGLLVERRNSIAKKTLVDALGSESEASVRETIARTLMPLADRSDVRDALLEHLESDPSGDVRGACAEALAPEAEETALIRRKLVDILASEEPPELRGGAAWGLARAARRYTDALEALRARVDDIEEDEWVRACSLWALEDILPSMTETGEVLRRLIADDSGSVVGLVAATLVSRYARTGKVPWEDLPRRSAEELLISLETPCAHALDALVGLVEARELKNLGIPREARIARALSSLQDRIRLSFVFGSTARNEQGSESDIDLIIIGGVSLEDVAPSLRQAEQELGKQVNAVVYSEEEWHRRCRNGSLFVKEVLEGEKIFVFGGQNELAAMG